MQYQSSSLKDRLEDRLAKFLEESSIYENTADLGGSLAKTQILTIVGNIIKQVIMLAAVVFIILLLYAGFIWMKAQGNGEEVQKAIGIFRTAILGMLILTFAAAITFTIAFFIAGAAYPTKEL